MTGVGDLAAPGTSHEAPIQVHEVYLLPRTAHKDHALHDTHNYCHNGITNLDLDELKAKRG